jgi:hypothetical protein
LPFITVHPLHPRRKKTLGASAQIVSALGSILGFYDGDEGDER